MKRLMLSLISFVLCFLVFNIESFALPIADKKTLARDYVIAGDDFVPIPWGKELPISWQTLPGTWILRQGKQPSTSYFTFQKINNVGSNKMLYIQQIDPKSCSILGSGIANQSDSKIIYATLRSSVNNKVYRINFRNYNASSFNTTELPTYEGHVMLMSIAPINSHEFTHYPLARVNFSYRSNINCMGRLVR